MGPTNPNPNPSPEQILGSFVFLNLVVAVILENFSSLGNLNPDLVSAADIEIFKEVWADFDPDADQKVPASVLPDLVLRIPPPMGVAGQDKRKALRFCLTLDLKQEPNGDLGFQDVMDALVNNNFQKQLTEGIPPAEQSDKVAEVLKQRDARMSRGSSVGGNGLAATLAAQQAAAVARTLTRAWTLTRALTLALTLTLSRRRRSLEPSPEPGRSPSPSPSPSPWP